MSKKRSITRTLVVAILTLAVLYLLFMPKYAGYEHYDIYYTPGTILEEEKCTCFGLEKLDFTNTTFEAKEYKCYGLATDCKISCKNYIGKIKVETDCPR